MIENNDNNRRKLAEQLVELWDRTQLENYIIDALIKNYEEFPADFYNDWEFCMPEIEEQEDE